MDRLSVFLNVGFIPSFSWKVGGCVRETMAFHSWFFLAGSDHIGCSLFSS